MLDHSSSLRNTHRYIGPEAVTNFRVRSLRMEHNDVITMAVSTCKMLINDPHTSAMHQVNQASFTLTKQIVGQQQVIELDSF